MEVSSLSIHYLTNQPYVYNSKLLFKRLSKPQNNDKRIPILSPYFRSFHIRSRQRRKSIHTSQPFDSLAHDLFTITAIVSNLHDRRHRRPCTRVRRRQRSQHRRDGSSDGFRTYNTGLELYRFAARCEYELGNHAASVVAVVVAIIAREGTGVGRRMAFLGVGVEGG